MNDASWCAQLINPGISPAIIRDVCDVSAGSSTRRHCQRTRTQSRRKKPLRSIGKTNERAHERRTTRVVGTDTPFIMTVPAKMDHGQSAHQRFPRLRDAALSQPHPGDHVLKHDESNGPNGIHGTVALIPPVGGVQILNEHMRPSRGAMKRITAGLTAKNFLTAGFLDRVARFHGWASQAAPEPGDRTQRLQQLTGTSVGQFPPFGWLVPSAITTFKVGRVTGKMSKWPAMAASMIKIERLSRDKPLLSTRGLEENRWVRSWSALSKAFGIA